MSSATESRPSPMIIETVTNCICLNEACDNREIPPHHVQRTIDRKSGEHVILAYCDACKTLYRARRALIGTDGLGPSTIEIVNDERTLQAFRKRVRAFAGDVELGKVGCGAPR